MIVFYGEAIIIFIKPNMMGSVNNKYEFQDLVEGVKNLECDCILWRDENYIHQTKHDGIRPCIKKG